MKQLKHVILLFLLMIGFLLMGASCFQHGYAKPTHAVLKQTPTGNIELLAEFEEDEIEPEDHFEFLEFGSFRLNEFSFSHLHSKIFVGAYQVNPEHKQELNLLNFICVYRI